MVTLPEPNVAPENGWLEDGSSFWNCFFGRCYVSSWESIFVRTLKSLRRISTPWHRELFKVYLKPNNPRQGVLAGKGKCTNSKCVGACLKATYFSCFDL